MKDVVKEIDLLSDALKMINLAIDLAKKRSNLDADELIMLSEKLYEYLELNFTGMY